MMIDVGVFVQFFSLYDLYAQWETSGVFDFLLPALLIFSIIFGILTSSGVLGGNRGINSVIAASAALMAMRLQIVSDFFSLLLPGLGIGVAVIVVVLIMAGLIVGLVIVVTTLNSFDWFGSYWWQQNWVSVVWIAVLVGILTPFFKETKSAKNRTAENTVYSSGMNDGRMVPI